MSLDLFATFASQNVLAFCVFSFVAGFVFCAIAVNADRKP